MLFESVTIEQQLPISTVFRTNSDVVVLSVSDSMQEEYFPLYSGERVLLLVTTGEKSVLATGEVSQSNDGNNITVDSGAFKAIGVSDGQKIDCWVIPDEQKIDLNYESGGRELDGDPTNGSWLLLKMNELALTDSSEDRRVYINKSFRE